MSLEIKVVDWDELPEDIKGRYNDEGYFIMVFHNGELLENEYDGMEPEDANFLRDLSWIGPLLGIKFIS